MQAPEFWQDRRLVARLLAPAGWVFAAGGWLRQLRARPVVVPVPVLCVGNLVAGGAGKTPTVLALAEILQARRPHILTRGYRGRLAGPVQVDAFRHTIADVGDEPLLLTRRWPTWVSRDRVAGAQAAAAAGAGVILMDDGFQNPALAKTLSVLVVDAAQGIGNGYCIPAGPLREPVSRGLRRADAVVLIGGGELPFVWRGPVFRAAVAPYDDAGQWRGRRVVAFAGIGRPGKFFATLDALGADVYARHAFADHHVYTGQEIERMTRDLPDGASLVTTEKDHVRLPQEWQGRVAALPVRLQFAEAERVSGWLSQRLDRDG